MGFFKGRYLPSLGKSEEQLPKKLSANCRLPSYVKFFLKLSADSWQHVGNMLAKCQLRTPTEYQGKKAFASREEHCIPRKGKFFH